MGAVDPTPCNVRVNYNQQRANAGDIESEGFVERAEEDILLRFTKEIWHPNTALKYASTSGSLIRLTEEYIIQRTLPSYGLTQDCEVWML